jgi:hypothetical protein
MKLLYNLFLVLLLSSNVIYSQWEQPRLFPNTDPDRIIHESQLLKLQNGDLIYFWLDGEKVPYTSIYSPTIKYAISNDEGITWGPTNTWEDVSVYGFPQYFLSSTQTQTGRIITAYYGSPFNDFYRYSDDNGITWSEPQEIPSTFNTRYKRSGKFSVSDSTLWFVFELKSPFADSYYIQTVKINDDGYSWDYSSNKFPVSKNSSPNFFISGEDQVIIYVDNSEDENKIVKRTSIDSGSTWSDQTVLFDPQEHINNLYGCQIDNGDITLVFEKSISTPFDSVFQSEIFYITSLDGGDTWSSEKQFTYSAGDDCLPSVSSINSEVLISFLSNRGDSKNEKDLWYGKLNATKDTTTPPHIYKIIHEKGPDSLSVTINAFVDDDIEVDSVVFNYNVNGNSLPSIQMLDDGSNGDVQAGDKIFTTRLSNFDFVDELEYSVRATDNQSNEFLSQPQQILFPIVPSAFVEVVDVNKIKLPLNNKGDFGNFYPNGSFALYDEKFILFSGGFFLAGYSGSDLWNVAEYPSIAEFDNFTPGPAGTNPNFEKHKLYKVRTADDDFSNSWQDWKLAVSMGAKFYDGNNDGIYDPIDLNYNGKWDANEDRPDMQGDLTYWCVYNDGRPSFDRRFDVDPQGIEVKQSVFASQGEGTHFENIIFVRYEIENTGLVAESFDSVYFGNAFETYIGDDGDELVGCDTLDNNGYAYNRGPDQIYGVNPPAFFVKQLQGPPVYISGETYIDVNNDQEFTPGTDTPLDSAVYKRGKYLETEILPGAKNLSPTAFTHFIQSSPYNGQPHEESRFRNYLIGGLDHGGQIIDPCTWPYGNGSALSNCSDINPKFMYSGDPVQNEGWINNLHGRQNFVYSTGPFNIEVGKPIELIFAMIVGRGTDHLNSITVAREISQFAQQVYDSNFEDLPTGIDDDENIIANDFKLYQNYPNPFNPATTIKFTIPALETRHASSLQNITLKIFDILGREIKTLVNEQKPAGTYEVQFDASQLSSGVYFYQLSAGNFIQTQKLMLLK